MTREQAIVIAKQAAKANPPSYYTDDTFEPHPWVVDAVIAARDQHIALLRIRIGELESTSKVRELEKAFDASRARTARLEAALRAAGLKPEDVR